MNQRFDLDLFPFHLDFDPAVGKVSNGSGQMKGRRAVLCEIPVSDPLHFPTHQDMSGSLLLHTKGSLARIEEPAGL